MTNSVSSFSVESIVCLPIAARRRLLRTLSNELREFCLKDWAFWARPEQLPPPGDWRIWLFLAGRGAGKTRAGAEWIAHGVCHGEMRRIGLVGATFHDARSVMIEGESGLLGVSPGAA